MTPHALHLGDAATFLATLRAQSANVVYIDPPYGTGAPLLGYKDDHPHHAWTSLNRTVLHHAARIVTPRGVVAVSIGQNRLFDMGLLIREAFPKRKTTTITVQASAGVTAAGIREMSEYLLLVTPEKFTPGVLPWAHGVARSPWEGATLSSSDSSVWPTEVYPVFVDPETTRIVDIGATAAELGADWRTPDGTFPHTVKGQPIGTVAVWPITRHGKACVWRITAPTFRAKLAAGYVKADLPHMPGNPNPYSIKHLPAGVMKRIASGEIHVREIDARGAAVFDPIWRPAGSGVPTVWAEKHHRTATGTKRLDQLLGTRHGFAFPKPVGLLTDMLTATGHTTGTVLDVFAGTGTLYDAITQLDTELTYLGVTNDETWHTAHARVTAVAAEHGTSIRLVPTPETTATEPGMQMAAIA